MGRSRVLSFMSAFGGPPRSPTPSSPTNNPPLQQQLSQQSFVPPQVVSTPRDSPTPPQTRTERSGSRPVSMIMQPPLMEVTEDTLPELQPIFTYLNSHSNKLYQEGYFLKLNDLDIYGRPNTDRTWTECFAQLVGTVLSLWDAAALDAAGQDGEVPPTFINLADASIKMIETLPTRSENIQPLQNVLSISTAGKNRFLLHFNSLHSLTQWTAGIRLSMFEHASLQEAYTGSLIAGKGKSLNNIKTIMEKTRFKHEDWARVRFGAGTPWRRCWCVISPPDEKEAKRLYKKRNPYERPPVAKGDIKFYDTKKIKKATPIATVTDAYSAYAIYPQSKPLIDASTLVKLEGTITIHSDPESVTEGFVFVMPEVHAAVSGFEMMLRWLFPAFDVFGLYGRPNKLVADTLDSRGLMFAMPRDRRYGYLEILDIAALIHADGSQNWSEREWRKQLKDATSRRMTSGLSRQPSRMGSRRGPRTSLQSRTGTLRFDDNASVRSSPSVRHEYNRSTDTVFSSPPKTRTAPMGVAPFPQPHNYHARSVSETVGFSNPARQRTEPLPASRLSYEANEKDLEEEIPPPPPQHQTLPYRNGTHLDLNDERSSSESDRRPLPTVPQRQDITGEVRPTFPPEPVAAPPAFVHHPGDKPQTRPNQAPELRRANSRMSSATLSQLVDAGRMGDKSGVAAAGAAAAWKSQGGRGDESGQRGVIDDANSPVKRGTTADTNPSSQAIITHQAPNPSSGGPPPVPEHRSPLPAASYSSDPSPQPLHGISASPPSHPKGPPRVDTGKSVTRKPVPVSKSVEKTDSPAAESLGSWGGNIDQEALDKVLARRTSPSSEEPPVRQSEDSRYSDTTPDYASTRKSTDTRESVPKPRAGVLKTVGTPDARGVTIGDARYDPAGGKDRNAPDIPTVDFGPTHDLAHGPKSRPSTSGPSRPGTSGAMTQWIHDRTPSDSLTPQDEKRFSYGRGSPVSPRPGNNSRGHSRSPSGADRRSMAWSPGAAVLGGRTSPGPRLTPEEFVQQRAAANRVSPPGYPHQRSSSGNIMHHKNSSGDWSQQQRPNSAHLMHHKNASGDLIHSRQASINKDLPQRPHSRGASVTLDYSSHLSAREQEHVARMTGQPLISMAGNAKPQSHGTGLVGAIAAREKEKKDIKDGLSGQMVQQAIAQRQQQAQAQAYHYSQQQHHQNSLMQYGAWNGAGSQQMGQQQRMNPGAQNYWSPPPGYPTQGIQNQNMGPQYQQQQGFVQSPGGMSPQQYQQNQQQQAYGGHYGR